MEKPKHKFYRHTFYFETEEIARKFLSEFEFPDYILLENPDKEDTDEYPKIAKEDGRKKETYVEFKARKKIEVEECRELILLLSKASYIYGTIAWDIAAKEEKRTR